MTDLNRAGCDFPERKTIVSPWTDGSGIMGFRTWKKNTRNRNLKRWMTIESQRIRTLIFQAPRKRCGAGFLFLKIYLTGF
ncbi:MAG TPA: hypothetical protein DCL41_10650 [Bdellovibrionales bacterium]|nr:hypothetical protein [Pseudobdellovibrionaceae bacterium]HAG92325.1 hypothetical protein [Bdellovibrionales bacterium]